MGIGQRLEDVVILAIDDYVIWLLAPPAHLTSAEQARINCISERGHNNEVVHRNGLRFNLIGIQHLEFGHLAAARFTDFFDKPEPRVTFFDRATLRQHTDLVALTDRT
ncbi:hypothetical protein WJ39_06845 [Burkholderia diffusa]|nr:hypothetical protein WJ39_06845 [Burkholderia diffusa]